MSIPKLVERAVDGRFGPYGGRYVPETLMAALEELEQVYEAAKTDAGFWAQLDGLLKDYVGRPTPLTEAPRLAAQVGSGVVVALKRAINSGALPGPRMWVAGTPLGPTGGNVSGTTIAATTDGSASCGNSAASPDVWYQISPEIGNSMSISTCPSPLPVALSVHTQCPGTVANEIACHQEGSCPSLCGAVFGTCLTIPVMPGNAYWIRVAGQNGATGNFNIRVTLQSTTPTGDFNGDGVADGADIQGFVAALFAGSTTPSDLAAGDFNADGRIDSPDVPGMVTKLLT